MGRRRPTIHVRADEFAEALQNSGLVSAKLSEAVLLSLAKPIQIRDRFLLKTNKQNAEAVRKSLTYSEESVKLFNKMLFEKQLTIHNYTHINKNSKVYTILKEATQEAVNFAERNQYDDMAKGFEAFLFLGRECMGAKFKLNSLKGYAEAIQERYNILKIFETGNNGDETIKFYQVYRKVCKKYSNYVPDLTKTIKDKGYLLWGMVEANTAKADYEDWITAQFEGLAFLDDIPKPSQFSGENAISRYEEYMGSKNVKTESGEGDFMDYASDEEKSYFEMIRGMRDED